MKAASAALIALINSGTFTVFDLYTVTMVGGGQLLFTTADVDIGFGASTWSSKGIRIGGTQPRGHWKTGLGVDQWQVSIAPRLQDDLTGAGFPDKIGSVPWLRAAANGALDASTVLIQRAYFASPPTYPVAPGGAVPVGLLTIFKGIMAEVDVNTTMAVLTINDSRQLLTTQMPRNLYQASCRHVLFDAQCGLSAAAFVKTATIGANSSRFVINASVAAPGGSGTYQLGRIVVTSGPNAGFSRTISRWDKGQVFTMLNPFPFDFSIGDMLNVYPGCDKTLATCTAFNNLLNYGGDPFIPPPGNSGYLA